MACLRREADPGRRRDVRCNAEGCELRSLKDGCYAPTHAEASEADRLLQLQLRAGDVEDTRPRVIEDWSKLDDGLIIAGTMQNVGEALNVNGVRRELGYPEWKPGRVRIGPRTLIETFVDDEPALREWIQLEVLRMFHYELHREFELELYNNEPVGERQPEPVYVDKSLYRRTGRRPPPIGPQAPGVRTYDDNSEGVV